MTFVLQPGYVLPDGDQPLTHARIAHAGNWRSGGTAVASSTETGYDADAPMNALTYERWKPTSSTATWEYDHGSSVSCNYCCIGAHTLGASGSTVTVQYWNGSTWVAVSPATAFTTDMAAMFLFVPVSAQRWRISITGTSAPEIGLCFFGLAMQMQRPLYGGHTPLHMARQTTLRANKSDTGEFLGRTKQRVQMATAFAWQYLTADWVRANWRPFQIAAEEAPFFLAWRPASFAEVYLCMIDEVPVPSNMGTRDFMSVEMSVRAYAHD